MTTFKTKILKTVSRISMAVSATMLLIIMVPSQVGALAPNHHTLLHGFAIIEKSPGGGGGGKTCNPTDGTCASCDPSQSSECVKCDTGQCVDQAAAGTCDQKDPSKNCDLVHDYLNPTINLFSSLVGIGAAASLIYAGIQYSMAGADPQKVSKAKNRIRMTLIAILAYAFLYGFIQFLVPGGVFNK